MKNQVIWIAEIGSNHKGIESLVYEYIRQAALSGATFAKFQFGRPKDDPIRHIDHLASSIAEWCDYWGVGLLASLWSAAGLKVAHDLGLKIHKIAHQQAVLGNPIAEEIMGSGDEVIVTLATPENWAFWAEYNDRHNAHWLWNSGTYPAYPGQHAGFPYEFGLDVIGISDHSHGIGAALTAIARGAKIVERHFTLDKTEESIKDNHFSSTPDEFAQLITIGEQVARFIAAVDEAERQRFDAQFDKVGIWERIRGAVQ